MKLINQASIEEGYKKPKGETFWEMDAEECMKDIIRLVPQGGKILDVGCGEGRNAIFLTKQGYSVDGIDISNDALERLRALCKKENLDCTTINGDIRTVKFDKSYDAVICLGVLHLLQNRQDIENLTKKLKSIINKHGIMAILAFTKNDPAYKESENLYFFDIDELASFFDSWEIITNEYFWKEETHGLPLHKHNLNLIICRKK